MKQIQVLLLLDHLPFPGRFMTRTGFTVEVQSREGFDARERIWRDTSDLIVQLAALSSSADDQRIGLAGISCTLLRELPFPVFIHRLF